MILHELAYGSFYRHSLHCRVRLVGSNPDDGACLILEVADPKDDNPLGELIWGESQDLIELFN